MLLVSIEVCIQICVQLSRNSRLFPTPHFPSNGENTEQNLFLVQQFHLVYLITRQLNVQITDKKLSLECSALQCSVVHCSSAHCSTVQCITVQCRQVQCSALQCSSVHCSGVQCSAVCVGTDIGDWTEGALYGSHAGTLLMLQIDTRANLQHFWGIKSRCCAVTVISL